MPVRPFAVVLPLSLLFAASVHSATATATPGLSVSSLRFAGWVDASQVSLQRRAVDLLEEQREIQGTDWADARLAEQGTPLHRPGDASPAYVEFAVRGPHGEPRGFMVLSTGEHDAPLAHAAHAGKTPTEKLRDDAGADEPARFYRLGHTYVAEDDQGRLLSRIGELPGEMTGYDTKWLDADAPDRRGVSRWSAVDGARERVPQVGHELSIVEWGPWSRIRAEYAENRAPLHERDMRAAAPAWEFERALARNGEVLQRGEFRELPLLPRGDAQLTVRGRGSEYVHIELVDRDFEGDRAIRAFVVNGVPEGIHPVDIDVVYADGARELLRLNVTERIPSHLLSMGAPAAVSATGVRRVKALATSGVECKKVALRAYGGTYLTISGDELFANGRDFSQAALFNVDHLGGGRVTLRAPNGKWVQALGGGGGEIKATAPGPTRNAMFRMFENRHSNKGHLGFLTSDRRHFMSPGHGAKLHAAETNDEFSDYELAMCEPRRKAAHWSSGTLEASWTKVRKYRQLEPKETPSTSQCASGCGATAWAMLFGYHDYEAGQGIPKWSHLTGLYRSGGIKNGNASIVAPEYMHDGDTETHGVKRMIWEIAQKMNDWTLAGCAPNGQKWTAPVIMGRAHKYLEGRVTGVTLGADYDGAMIFTHEGKTKAKNIIVDLKQPVVIGIRDPEHYPVAFGWETSEYRLWDRGQHKWNQKEQRSHFVVHMGHHQQSADLVPYDSWYQGWLRVPAKANGAPAKPANEAKTEQNKTIPKPEPTPKHIPTPHKAKPGTVNPKPKPKGPSPVSPFNK